MLFHKRFIRLREAEREHMRAAGRFNARLMDLVRENAVPGVTTRELDRLVYEYTLDHGHLPAQLGYQGFPACTCISVNDVVCHGIPGDYILKEGDIFNLDATTVVDGWHGDSSETFLVGRVSPMAQLVTQAAFDAMWAAIESLTPGCPIANIGKAVVATARPYGFGVVRDYVGHGVGRNFHQEPSIPHFPQRQARFEKLDPGVCFTVEPMLNTGSRITVTDKRDGWTVRTKDGGLSAQFEHTVLMTEDGPEILTTTEHGPQRGRQF